MHKKKNVNGIQGIIQNLKEIQNSLCWKAKPQAIEVWVVSDVMWIIKSLCSARDPTCLSQFLRKNTLEVCLPRAIKIEGNYTPAVDFALLQPPKRPPRAEAQPLTRAHPLRRHWARTLGMCFRAPRNVHLAWPPPNPLRPSLVTLGGTTQSLLSRKGII